jgi:ankyrin repeat protein
LKKKSKNLIKKPVCTVIGHYFSSLLDINSENSNGNTALHLCANSFETVGITETLLKHGAKMTQNKHGLSPLQVAALRLLDMKRLKT